MARNAGAITHRILRDLTEAVPSSVENKIVEIARVFLSNSMGLVFFCSCSLLVDQNQRGSNSITDFADQTLSTSDLRVLQHLDHFKLDLLKTRPLHIWTKKLDHFLTGPKNLTNIKLNHLQT